MKSKIILLVTAVILSLTTFSQTKRRLNWNDFTESIQKTIIAEPVPYGKFAIFQIDNINKFLYKVTIEGKTFELETPIPTELQTLFRLNTKELDKTAENKKAKEGVDKLPEGIAQMQNVSDKMNSFVKQAAFVAEKNEEKKEKTEAFTATMQELVEKCKEYKEKAILVAGSIFDLKKARVDLITIAQLDMSFESISNKANEVTIPADTKALNESLQLVYAELEELYETAKEMAKDVNSNADNDDKKAIEKASKQLEKAHDLITDDNLLSLVTEITFLKEELKNPKNFIVVAPPVQMDGDFANYVVQITPEATKTVGVHKSPMRFSFDIPVKGGWKADFSVGPVFSFGKNAKNESYFLKPSTKTDTSTLEKVDNRNALAPGMAAMMHVYWRSGQPYSFGAMFGVGAGFTSTNDANLSVFLGGTAVLGKRQKIILSAGLSFLRVDRLKTPQFNPGTEYNNAKIDINTVTTKVFRGSPFFSFSYNLSNRKELN